MKKKLTVLALALLLLFSVSLGASAEMFDYTELSSLPGYSYDSTNNVWYYIEMYNDGKLQMVFMLQGTPTEISLTSVAVSEKAAGSEVEGLKITVGGKVYSYDVMNRSGGISGICLGQSGQALIHDVAEADYISVRLVTGNGNLDFVVQGAQFENSLKRFCKNYLKYDMWGHANQALHNRFETEYPLFVY